MTSRAYGHCNFACRGIYSSTVPDVGSCTARSCSPEQVSGCLDRTNTKSGVKRLINLLVSQCISYRDNPSSRRQNHHWRDAVNLLLAALPTVAPHTRASYNQTMHEGSKSSPHKPMSTWLTSLGLLPLLLGVMLQQSSATPQQFVSNVAKADCSAHPIQNYGQHGEPVPDIRVSINVRPIQAAVQGSQGLPSTAPALSAASALPSTAGVCSSGLYAVDVNFGGARVNALVTSSLGKLVDATARPGLAVVNDAAEALGLLNLYAAECPNRYTTPTITRGVSLVLEVPTNVTEAVILRVTSASGPFDNFRTAAVSLPILPQQQCSSAGVIPASSAAAAGPGSATASESGNTTGTFVSTEPLPTTSADIGSVIATTVQQPVTVAAQPLPPTPEEQALLEQIAAANGAGDVTNSVMNNDRISSGSQVLLPAAAGNAADGVQSQLVMPLLGCVSLFLLH